MKRILFVLLLLAGCGKAVTEQAEYERLFQERMQNVTLVGQSTRTNKEGVFGPEKYKIESVSKVSGDTWLFKTRLRYDGQDLPVPIPVTVKWAGDTPVITLTGLTIGQLHNLTPQDIGQELWNIKDEFTASFNKSGRHDFHVGGEYMHDFTFETVCSVCMGVYTATGGPIPEIGRAHV